MMTAPDVTLVVVFARALPDGPPITREHLRQDHLPVCPELRGWRRSGGNQALPGRAGARARFSAGPRRAAPYGWVQPVMTCLRAREASPPVRAWGGTVGATSLLPVINFFFSASRMRPVRTRQAQAR